tara:strand:- start:4184 stop:4336 length:153 start_codon:yes stop_codon:yes gene_type:complete
MLVMPDLKDIIKDKQQLINNQRFQIDKLQKEVYKMYLKIKELDVKKSDTK